MFDNKIQHGLKLGMNVHSNMVNIIMFRPMFTVKYCVCGYSNVDM